MEKKGLSQEVLKIIACVTMFIDHFGAVMYGRLPFITNNIYILMRSIGRIAFPIYCFLLAEGAHYTKNPKKYTLRLAIGMLLSEIPFDLCLKKQITWLNQSVMVTLLMGFLAIELIDACKNGWGKIAIGMVFCWIAEIMRTDYGGYGVLLMILFSQTRGNFPLQSVLLLMTSLLMNSARVMILGYRIPIEVFAVAAMIPISVYSGKKMTSNRAVQWGFYLFYPVHLTALYIAVRLMTK